MAPRFIGSFIPKPAFRVNGVPLAVAIQKHLRKTGRVRLPGPEPAIAVIIPCHNYGRFLQEAIESVLRQSRPAAEIVVVDDASTDNTAEVARQFPTVRYVRIEAGNVLCAQRAGFQITHAPVVCFLDADDVMPRNYLESGVMCFADTTVAVAFSSIQNFGDKNELVVYNLPADMQSIERQNFCHSASLVRRDAIEVSGAFDAHVRLPWPMLQDWALWRAIARKGFRFAKHEAPLLRRNHGANWLTRVRQENWTYFVEAALANESLTLFIPFAGRFWAWPKMREFLERQKWPHSQTRLMLCDTSDNPRFGRMLRRWAMECEYGDVRYMETKLSKPGSFADRNRRNSFVAQVVDSAMPRIYNRMATEATTEYVWVIEDDILPPLDAGRRLMQHFNADVASVAGIYRHRFEENKLVTWDDMGLMLPDDGSKTGVVGVRGNGFGCVIHRRSMLRRFPFHHRANTNWYDANYYIEMALNAPEMRVLADFSVRCEHRERQPARKGRRARTRII